MTLIRISPFEQEKEMNAKTACRVIVLFLFGLYLGLLENKANAEDYPGLYSPTDQYMGEISDAPWRNDSISNPIGQHGSRLSPDSIHNPLGQFGNEYSSESPYYIGRQGSLKRPENRRLRSRLRRELRRERDWLE